MVNEGKDGQFFQHARHRLAVQHLHLHGGLELRQRGFDLPAPAVQLAASAYETVSGPGLRIANVSAHCCPPRNE